MGQHKMLKGMSSGLGHLILAWGSFGHIVNIDYLLSISNLYSLSPIVKLNTYNASYTRMSVICYGFKKPICHILLSVHLCHSIYNFYNYSERSAGEQSDLNKPMHWKKTSLTYRFINKNYSAASHNAF